MKRGTCQRVSGDTGRNNQWLNVMCPCMVQLYSVPETVAVDVPAIRQFKYMMVNDRVVLVDPVTSQVVGELAD